MERKKEIDGEKERELMKQKSRKMFRETIEENRSMVEKREVGSGEGTENFKDDILECAREVCRVRNVGLWRGGRGNDWLSNEVRKLIR